MGFLDDVVGKVKEAVGGGEHSALAKGRPRGKASYCKGFPLVDELLDQQIVPLHGLLLFR